MQGTLHASIKNVSEQAQNLDVRNVATFGSRDRGTVSEVFARGSISDMRQSTNVYIEQAVASGRMR